MQSPCFLIAERIAERELAFDREVALCASLLHDVGALPKTSRSLRYIDDGKDVAREVLRAELHGFRAAKHFDTTPAVQAIPFAATLAAGTAVHPSVAGERCGLRVSPGGIGLRW